MNRVTMRFTVLGLLFAVATLLAACGPSAEPTSIATDVAASPASTEVTAAPTGMPPSATARPDQATSEPSTPSVTPLLPEQRDPAVGQQLWSEKPCMSCHGANAEGGVGPRLAGTGLSLDEVLLRVRTGAAPMPAFTENEISDLEVRHIHAWLQSLGQPARTPTQSAAGSPPTDALLAMRQHVNSMKVKSDFAKDLPERQASDLLTRPSRRSPHSILT